MSVLIKGMKIPSTCAKCNLKNAIECDRWKRVRSDILDRHKDCPLVPVSPHGRCVDANKLMQEMRLFIKENILSRDDARELLETIEDAPTVIEAEEE